MEGAFDEEGTFDIGSRSLVRSTFGDDRGSKSPIRETPLTEPNGDDGDSPNSSMTERILNDRASIPERSVRSRNPSRSPMRESGFRDFDFDGVGNSQVSLKSASKSPLREIGGRSPMSVRSRYTSRSPMRDLNGVSKSLVTSTNGDLPNVPMRGDVFSKFDEDVEAEGRRIVDGNFVVEEEARGRNIAPKNHTVWITDEIRSKYSNVNYPSRSWIDQFGNEVDQIGEGRESMYADEYGMASEGSVDDPTHGFDLNKNIMHQDFRLRAENFGGYATSRGAIDQWVRGRNGIGVEQSRFSASSSTVDGPSSYHPNPIYGYGNQRHNFVDMRGPASVQDLELERAELLWKYKELKDQLNGLDNRRLSSPGSYGGPDDYSEDDSWRFRRESVRPFAQDNTVRRSPQFDHDSVPVHDMGDLYNYHPSQYDDLAHKTRWPHRMQPHKPIKHGMPGRIPCRSLDFDQESFKSYHDIIPGHIRGRSVDVDLDSLNSYHDEMHTHYHHHPGCSCSVCYVRDWQSRGLPDALSDVLSVSSAANLRSTHSMLPPRHVPRPYNSRMAQTYPREQPPRPAHRHPRTLVTTLNKKFCYPIAGGSPFVICFKCFRLLKLPQKLMQKKHDQVKCGACSAMMSFDLQNGSFGTFLSQKKLSSAVSSTGFGEILKKIAPKHRRGMTATSTNIGSYDFDAVGCSFQAMDSDPSEVSKVERLSAGSADNMHRLSAASSQNSRSSKEDFASDTASVRSSQPASTVKPFINLAHPPPGSPLLNHFDYSNCFRKLQAEGKKNNDGEEKEVLRRDGSLESSENSVSIKWADYSLESQSAQGPGDVEDDKAANPKDKNSSIASFMKWGFVSKSGRRSPGKAEVFVNGQPISHRMVKKAEKFAGPVEPGDYWYDSKAGFWGVMGHQCLGIIPPSIQEFSSPMPENCSGGDTAIFVNGRELHKKDLDLLTSRGLPMTSNKRYIIGISGKVVEEGTREFVVNLGKLAPSVETKKCGYGMQVPEDLQN